MNKPLRVGLFGFGRIGRNIFRLGYRDPKFDFVAISDLGDVEAMHYLLVRDSIHGSIGRWNTRDNPLGCL
jgi:glyceraldehyde-3-phosphate dehydrogenase/erythrose-4-phosphate dehydrogenase